MRRRSSASNPADAIGKTVKSGLFEPEYRLGQRHHHRRRQDSRFRSVRTPLDPIMFQQRSEGQLDDRPLSTATRRRSTRRSSGSGNRSPATCRSRPSSATTSSRELYKAEDARAKIFAAFALLAVVIGCLGLFGLAAFTAERRTKEIGIRKVLGARTRDIVRLLVWQFSRPVMIANIIAWPVAWWVMRDWLNGFDQRIALTRCRSSLPRWSRWGSRS